MLVIIHESGTIGFYSLFLGYHSKIANTSDISTMHAQELVNIHNPDPKLRVTPKEIEWTIAEGNISLLRDSGG